MTASHRNNACTQIPSLRNPARLMPLTAGLVAFALAQPASAESAPTPAQLMDMIQAQQRQLDALKLALEKAQAEAAMAAEKGESGESMAEKVVKSIDIGGVIEVEMTESSTFADADTSDITLAKVELYFDTNPHDYLQTHVQFIYEDDGTETISLDEGYAILGNTEAFPLYLQAGKWAVPFGGFDTFMSTDPVTKDFGETKEAAVLVGATYEGFTLEGYIYNGDTQQTGEGDHIDQFGVSLAYETDVDGVAVSIGGGYISNIADSDGMTTGLGGSATALRSYVPGAEIHASVGYQGFTLLGGYMTALDSFETNEFAFNGQRATPSAWNLEAAYTTEILEKETTFAATVQGTGELLTNGMAETRVGGAVTVGIWDNVAVTAEYLHDEDYDTSEGGTGNDQHTATLKLAVEF